MVDPIWLADPIPSLPCNSLWVQYCKAINDDDVFRFVHAINVNAFTFGLEYLHARFPDRDFLTCAAQICPNIKELLIEDQVSKNFDHLISN